MENKKDTGYKRGITEFIISVTKKNLPLIILVVIFAVVAGVLYAKLKKPYYTASEKVFYSATVVNSVGESSTETVANENAMTVFVQTVMDFCDTGVVLDRANSYYNDYLSRSGVSVEDFISEMRAVPDYEVKTGVKAYFTNDNVGYSSPSEQTSQRVFTIFVQSYDLKAVRDMVRIYALAYDIESTDYFGGVKTSIAELVYDNGGVSVSSDVSTMKILVISFALGILLAVAIVYLKFVFNNTVTEEDDLELITGANTLAYIEDTEVKR